MEIVDNAAVIKQGDSLYVRIPANIARVLGIEKGTRLQVGKENRKLIYEKK